MPRNGKEEVLFSFIMSALMIYLMAALNMYVRAALELDGLQIQTIWEPWWYAVINFPLAYAVGMICDLGFCTPTSRKIMMRICAETDRPAWKGFVVKFCMVVLMTIAMTVYGALAAVGFRIEAIAAFFVLLPYNFIIALPLQMCLVAPLAGKIVHATGDRFGWNEGIGNKTMPTDIARVADVMQHDVYSVPSDATVLDALKALLEKGVSGMPVVDEKDSVVGFVSDSDILRMLSKSDAPVSDYSTLVTGLAKNELPKSDFATLMEANVLDIATRNVCAVSPTDKAETLCELFGRRQFKKVPVVENGTLSGVVNRSRLARKALESYLAA